MGKSNQNILIIGGQSIINQTALVSLFLLPFGKLYLFPSFVAKSNYPATLPWHQWGYRSVFFSICSYQYVQHHGSLPTMITAGIASYHGFFFECGIELHPYALSHFFCSKWLGVVKSPAFLSWMSFNHCLNSVIYYVTQVHSLITTLEWK